MAPKNKTPKVGTAEEAVQCIKSGDRIFVQGMAATPSLLTSAMATHGKEARLEGCEVYHLHTEGECPYVAEDCEGIFHTKSFFLGANVRKATQEGRADYVPIFLSETPLVFRKGVIPLDVAIVQVSPPDKHGFCSLGTSVDCTRAALQTARTVIAMVNKNVPRTHGDGIIHYTNLDHIVYHDTPLYTSHSKPGAASDVAIGNLIAEHLVADGATLQLGIGNIPNAVLAQLKGHKNLGIHSEMFSDGVLPLVESGVVNNSQKSLDRGKLVSTFLVGSQALYDFVDDNPVVDMRDAAYTNDPHVIKQQQKMTAINSCIEVDLTGQVVSDSIGTRIYSGVGGQLDFLRGAALSEGGRPILALPSRTNKGRSRIVPTIAEGAGVVTTRAHVNYIVTEFGIAYLHGRSLSERATALIAVAHPEDRPHLEAEAQKRGLLGKLSRRKAPVVAATAAVPEPIAA
ncbi:acetyl-CoA hydrolase/transferase C-terminal domain-containing protein [Tribonema minus]|uniref:Acetyl-CoA hydrolase/transferase C-terminal domain-containing protein n=1 Tax=Tribonema minus TaxID=303371 RepID=A0A835Z7K5_9STRA|nr:acetyl-CoA hydrolase/transferase C-terminal domain-containing protein [Tribonema minus]